MLGYGSITNRSVLFGLFCRRRNNQHNRIAGMVRCIPTSPNRWPVQRTPAVLYSGVDTIPNVLVPAPAKMNVEIRLNWMSVQKNRLRV